MSTSTEPPTANGQFCWPPAGSYMAANGQDLMAADIPVHRVTAGIAKRPQDTIQAYRPTEASGQAGRDWSCVPTFGATSEVDLARMGYGEKSEWQLTRMLGRHRSWFTDQMSAATGLSSITLAQLPLRPRRLAWRWGVVGFGLPARRRNLPSEAVHIVISMRSTLPSNSWWQVPCRSLRN